MNKLLGFAIALMLGFSNISIAESVAIPAGQQGASKQNIERPARGSSKEQVSSRFGAPSDRVSAVGEPPISRWVYTDFTVYFDGEYVIHSVIHP